MSQELAPQDTCVLVTGGAGFIGSTLANYYSKDNQVVVIDDLSMGQTENLNTSENITFIEGSVIDQQLMEKVLQEYQFDYIFHLAAIASVADSVARPVETHQVNFESVLQLLELIRKYQKDLKRLVFASSAAVYGNLDTLPLNEEMIGNPSSFYGLTKLTTEHYLRIYHESFGLPYICYRYSNVFGPRQGNGGEGGVISIFAKAIVQGSPIIIYGDGKQTRDFIYVDDVVEANILGIQHQVTGIYNVSTGISSSVNLLVDEFRNISGKDIEVVYDKPRLGDIRDSVLATDKSEKELLFTAKYNLHDGLIKTYEYFKTVEG